MARPFGIKGGVVIKLFNDKSHALQPGVAVALKKAGQSSRDLIITSAENGRIFFANVNDREGSESLKGYEVYVDRALLPKLDESEYYLTDLLNAAVVTIERKEIARVIGFSSNSAQDLLEIEMADHKRSSIPMVKHFIKEIDVKNGLVVVDLPEGLLELAG